MRAVAATAALLLGLAACRNEEPVVIDGSSPETFARTTAEARRQLPDAQRLEFDEAMRTVGGRRHAARDPDALARVTFDGMPRARSSPTRKRANNRRMGRPAFRAAAK